MKRNAIVRICVYALLIAVLIVILLAGLFGVRSRPADTAESMAAEPVTQPVEDRVVLATGKLLLDFDIYASPTTGSMCSGRLVKGQSVNIYEIVTTDGEEWAHVGGQVSGWIPMLLLDVEEIVQISTAPTVQEPTDSPAVTGTATAKENFNIRTAPSADANICGMLKQGDSVDVLLTRNVLDLNWACVNNGETLGWVLLDGLVLEEEGTEPVGTEHADAEPMDGQLHFNADNITELEIHWAAGTMIIQPGDVSDITIAETKQNTDKALAVSSHDGKLEIRFQKGWESDESTAPLSPKDLHITVPRDYTLRDLEVESTGDRVTLRNMTIGELEFEGAATRLDLDGCTIKQLDVDTVSGQVGFTGNLDKLDFEGASAAFTGVFQANPSTLDFESTSGKLDITLPKGSGFTATLDGSLTSDFSTKQQGNTHVTGDGSCRIRVEGPSGGLTVREAAQ